MNERNNTRDRNKTTKEILKISHIQTMSKIRPDLGYMRTLSPFSQETERLYVKMRQKGVFCVI